MNCTVASEKVTQTPKYTAPTLGKHGGEERGDSSLLVCPEPERYVEVRVDGGESNFQEPLNVKIQNMFASPMPIFDASTTEPMMMKATTPVKMDNAQ